MTASELEKDLQNQIDSLQSDYDQMIGITEEDFLEQKADLEEQLYDVREILSSEEDIINQLIEE
jgi:hypothetical protein